jgi:ABC-type antimicrobial peptide transport system permease subunit
VSLLRRRFEVVGVVRAVHASARLDREAFLVFSVVNQSATIGSSFTAVVRGRGTGSSVVPQVTSAVRAMFPDPARWNVTTANDLIVRKLGGERLGATIFATNGASAAALALSGLFGLALLTVTRNRRALGIRMALGAGPSQLAMLVGKVALLPVVWGILAGTLLTWIFARILQSSVPEYGGVGTMTYVVGAALYLIGASLAVTPTLRGLRRLRPNEVLRAL